MPNNKINYITPEEYTTLLKHGLKYKGFVIGVGYAYITTAVIPPATMDILNPPKFVPHGMDHYQHLKVQCLNTSDEAIELSLKGNPEIEKDDKVEEATSQGETWYYGVQFSDDAGNGDPGHAFAYNPNTGMIYEVHHPSNDVNEGAGFFGSTSALFGTVGSGKTISIGRRWNYAMNPREFLSFRNRPSNICISPVYIPNSQGAIDFFESWVGKSWDYSLFTYNCKDFVIQGFNAGGANIISNHPQPNVWVSEFTRPLLKK